MKHEKNSKVKAVKLCLFILFFVFTNSFSQITFQRIFDLPGNQSGYSVIQTSNGDYMVQGAKYPYGVCLVKTDSFGDTLWTKTYEQCTNEGHSLIEYNNNFLIVGKTCNWDNLAPTPHIWEMIVTDSGSVMATLNHHLGIAFASTVTNNGSYAVTGINDSNDIFLELPFSPVKIIFGGTSLDMGKSVRQTTDNGFIIAGTTYSFGADSGAIYLIKTDSTGNLEWQHVYGANGKAEGYSVCQTNDGGYIIAGSSRTFLSVSSDVYLLKTDSTGAILWDRSYGGNDNDFGYSLDITNDGGYIIAGTTLSYGAGGADAYLIRTDSAGNALWSKTYGGTGNDTAYSVQHTTDSGFIIAGTTGSFGIGNAIYLIKTDSTGNSGCNESNPSLTTTVPNKPKSTPVPQTGSSGTPIGGSEPGVMKGHLNTIGLCSAQSIDEIEHINKFMIFPNPNRGNFSIKIKNFNSGILKINIINATGQKPYSASLPELFNEVTNINANIPPGIYIVEVSDDVNVFRQKLIIL